MLIHIFHNAEKLYGGPFWSIEKSHIVLFDILIVKCIRKWGFNQSLYSCLSVKNEDIVTVPYVFLYSSFKSKYADGDLPVASQIFKVKY